jgi:hypothetical protein
LSRLLTFPDRLLVIATEQPLTSEQALDARRELETTREGIERLNAILTLRRQDLRPM